MFRVCRRTAAFSTAALLACLVTSARAEKPKFIEVKTTFENGEQIDPAVGLLLGTSPAQARLTGGRVEIRGVRSAYNTPPHAWVFDEGEGGAIEFETSVRTLTFFAAVRANRGSMDPPNGSGFITLLNRNGKVIKSPVVLISAEPGADPQVFRGGLAIPLIDGHPQTIVSLAPIGTVLLDHTATGQSFLAIDDLSYSVRVGDDDDDDDDDEDDDD